MGYTFPEALDAIIEDNACIRRSKYTKDRTKYVCKQGLYLMYINGLPYSPTNEDLFANDWQIFGKGILGTGRSKKEYI